MNKRLKIFVVFAILSCFVMFSLIACDEKKDNDSKPIVCVHNFVVQKNTATCESNGVVIYKCTKCSETKSEATRAYGHKGMFICDNCKQKFTDLIYPFLKSNTSESVENGEKTIREIMFKKSDDNELMIVFKLTSKMIADYTIVTVFLIEDNGSWDYIHGVKYSGAINDEGEMRGRLDYSNLYLYREISLTNNNFKMPYFSATGNSDMKELLYDTLKSTFALALRLLQLGCIEQGNISMANFGFVNF